MASTLIPELLRQGHQVQALARPGSERKVPSGASVVPGDALRAATFSAKGCDTFVHLTGVAKPSPLKAKQFLAVDEPSLQASLEVACRDGVEHFIYVSVAQPAPVMRPYVEVRRRCETRILATGIRATFLRPWYVLGRGHWWPVVLVPFYAFAEQIPAWRQGALRLGLVTHREMTLALLDAVNHPPSLSVRCLDVPGIREVAQRFPSTLGERSKIAGVS
jgi:uncharacterized protein YbjT (DUF2867 family)